MLEPLRTGQTLGLKSFYSDQDLGPQTSPVDNIYTVFDEESESEVESLEILHPDLEVQENPPKC